MEEGLNPAFDGRWLPIISAIIVTRPLAAAELARHRWQNLETFSTARDVLNYFRVLPDGRFLFGGRGTSLGDPDGERIAYRDLSRTLARLFPAWSDIEIEYRWHGLICFTARLVPTLGHLPDDPSAWFAYGYHGNGVSEATWSGRQLADWIGRGQPPAGLPAAVRGLPKRFPLPALRKHYFQLALALAKWRDARSVRAALRS